MKRIRTALIVLVALSAGLVTLRTWQPEDPQTNIMLDSIRKVVGIKPQSRAGYMVAGPIDPNESQTNLIESLRRRSFGGDLSPEESELAERLGVFAE